MTFYASPYVPSFIKASIENSRPVQLTFKDISTTNATSDSSFVYDPAKSPLKNSQQLNVNWSDFSNHVFFSSAEAKVNTSFDLIINGYPFDGTKSEVEEYFENLTGFDKYIFDQFPRFKGQLHFSGTQVGEDTNGTSGVWIRTNDNAGSLYPNISKKVSGESIVNPPATASFSIECYVKLPEITNDVQVIFQKAASSTKGISLYVDQSASSTSANVIFCVMSGSSYIKTSAELEKGIFNHICVALDRETSEHSARFFLNKREVNTSRNNVTIGYLDINDSPILIGTGSEMSIGGASVLPLQTFSGTLDEFRVFHSLRDLSLQKLYFGKSLYATPDLRLYYRFNEPGIQIGATPSDTTNSIVLDSSGNSLHSTINNYFNFVDYDVNGNITASLLRENAEDDAQSLMQYEKDQSTVVLFPSHEDIITLSETLLTSASLYDAANPNLITKLIPQHYLLEGALADGYSNVDGTLGTEVPDYGLPGQSKFGSTHLLLSFLYIWARFFDELKLFVDSFGTLRSVDYDSYDTAPDNFLIDIAKEYGFNLPPLFNDATVEQYVDAENIEQDTVSNSTYSLRYVQNQLLRRILVNLPNILKSKGTLRSIKSFLRSVGIDPDNSLRIREYGGPTKKQLINAREVRIEQNVMLQFSTSSLATSTYLSSSRVEPGYPTIRGNYVQSVNYPPRGISDNVSDGLLTSGSWSAEAIYKWPLQQRSLMTSATQSLFRMLVTGSTNLSSNQGLIVNLLAISSSLYNDNKIILYARPSLTGSSRYLRLELNMLSSSIFDGDRWNICVGRQRNDQFASVVSSSYFIRIAKQSFGEIENLQMTSSFFMDFYPATGSVYDCIDADYNASGTYIAVGTNQSINSGSGIGYQFLNEYSTVPGEARTTSFDGRISNLRFWSKALTEDEWKEHVRNYNSVGVYDPTKNWNFVKTESGSFERLRLNTFTKQETRIANGTASLGPLGSITFLDFSQNENHLQGTGFPIDERCLLGETFDHSYISPYFDEAVSSNKIRVRSYQDYDLVKDVPWASLAPLYEIPKSEEPTDDTRFSIEYSLIDALNKDIISMFSSLEIMNNILGNPELQFSSDYPGLESLRDAYVNRLSQKLNFRAFFDFYRWFDSSVGSFIDQLIPRKVNFRGMNFVVESHMLERHKMSYYYDDMYVKDENRYRIRDVLLVQQISGMLRKY